MDDQRKIPVTFDLEELTSPVAEMAIKSGLIFDDVIQLSLDSYLHDRGNANRNELSKITIQFDRDFRTMIQDAIKTKTFKDVEIEKLKEAYFYFQMGNRTDSLPNPKIHDKSRLKKYFNARDTIEELLTKTNLIDREQILERIDEALGAIATTQLEQKLQYRESMNVILNNLNLSNYAIKELIISFQIFSSK